MFERRRLRRRASRGTRYERQTGWGDERRKSERGRMVILGPGYLRQEGGRPKYGEADGRSPEGNQLCNRH